MPKYLKLHYILSLLVCAIPAALVAGAAVLECFVFLSCLFFFYLNWKKIGLNYYRNIFVLFFFLFYFFLVFSSVSSEYVFNSIRNSMFYFRFGILTLVIWYLLDSYKKFKFLFFISIAITLLVVIFYTFLQLFVLHNQLDPNRISGLFGSESIQGSFLLRITPIFIMLYCYSREYLNRSFHYLFYLILFSVFILIIISGERSAIFLMFVAIFLGFIFFKTSLKKTFLYLLLISLTFLLTINFYPKSKERIFDTTYKQIFVTTAEAKKIYVFSEGHQHHFESAIIMFKQHYIKGVGVRNFRKECEKDIYKKVGIYYCTTHPHNTYMQLLSETGLIGFSFIMFFLIFIFRKSYKFLIGVYTKKNKINIPLGLGFIIVLVNFFPFVTTGSFFNNWLSAMYFLPVGFLLHELNCKKN